MRDTSALPLVVAYANHAAAVCSCREVRVRNFFELDPIFDNDWGRKLGGRSTDTLEVCRPPSLELSPVLNELAQAKGFAFSQRETGPGNAFLDTLDALELDPAHHRRRTFHDWNRDHEHRTLGVEAPHRIPDLRLEIA